MASALAKLLDTVTTTTTHDSVRVNGVAVGCIERRYGLLRCEENVAVNAVFDRTGDLAVADRLAYVYASRTHEQVAVVEHDGWYYVGSLDRPLTLEQAAAMRPLDPSVRLHTLATARGITPIVSPLVMPN